MGKTNKDIDAVAMTRRIRDAHYEALKEKSLEERIQFYRDKSRALRAQLSEKEQNESS